MIVDANILVSAVLGRSHVLLVNACERGIDLFMPEHQMRESRAVTRREGARRQIDVEPMLELASSLVIALDPDIYIGLEEDARVRLAAAGQKDWPVLALAMLLEDEVWSNDIDLFGTGVPVWTTRNIIYARPRRG